MKKLLLAWSFAASLSCICAGASAQGYPSKPITIYHGLGVGGQTDLSVRLLATALAKRLNVPVVVQAKPGAAQAIAAGTLANSAPDGYTLGHFYQGALSTVPMLQSVPYTLDDFAPIIAWQMSPQMLVVRSDSPLKNLADLVAAAKADPRIAFAHNGKGSVTFMAPTVFAKVAGITMTDVQYKGDADVATALLGGHIPVASLTEVAAAPHIQSGKMRALVTFAKVRSTNFPEIPTFEDQGFKVPIQVPVGILFAPRNTPAPIIKRIHDEVRAILADQTMKREFAEMKQVLYYMEPAAIREMIEHERTTYQPYLQQAGLTR